LSARAALVRRAPKLEPAAEMTSQTITVLYVLLLVVAVLAVDFLFFRNQFWSRLAANLGIVLVFVAFYFRFLKRP
jgi:hypothetical protein